MTTAQAGSQKTSHACARDAAQRVLAFGALILMFIIFSFASPYFLTGSNISGILIATAVNGVLAIGVTFVIITGGIDLSVGTVMTLTTVMMGKVDHGSGACRSRSACWRAWLTGVLAGFVNGFLISKAKLPPFIATLGMLNVAKGLSLVISKVKPIYFDQNPVFNQIAMGSLLNLDRAHPRPDDQQRGADPVRRGDRRQPDPVEDRARPLHLCAGQQRGGGPPVGRQRQPLEDRGLLADRLLRGAGRHRDGLAHQLGPASARARATSSTRSPRP